MSPAFLTAEAWMPMMMTRPMSPQTTGIVSLTELSDALNESVADVPMSKPVMTHLTEELRARHLNLKQFCRAVRATMGAGVLTRAVRQVATNKAAARYKGLWRRSFFYARTCSALIYLHKRALIRAEHALPPTKRTSVRELSTARSDGTETSIESSLQETSGMKRDREACCISPQASKRVSCAEPNASDEAGMDALMQAATMMCARANAVAASS